MIKSIFLCSSMSFYKDLLEIEKELVKRGFKVGIPHSAEEMKKDQNFDPANFKNGHTPEERRGFIHQNFENIAKCDAILVVNNDKNGVKNYIGPNVLMEIGIAFYFKKQIFIWNEVSSVAPFKDELNVFGVRYINRDLNEIDI